MSANDKQVGGAHYQGETGIPQHWDIAIAMGWDYLTGNATKYLWRLGKKGGPEKELEDLQKAIHYLEKKQEVLRAKLVQRSVSMGNTDPLKKKAPARPGMPEPHPYGSMAAPLGTSHEDGGPTRAYVNQD